VFRIGRNPTLGFFLSREIANVRVRSNPRSDPNGPATVFNHFCMELWLLRHPANMRQRRPIFHPREKRRHRRHEPAAKSRHRVERGDGLRRFYCDPRERVRPSIWVISAVRRYVRSRFVWLGAQRDF
jgi:hypothetical protein